MNPKNAARWATTRKLGRRQFVLRYGVLAWGVPVAIFFVVVEGLLHGWKSAAFQATPALVLFPLGGILYGRIMWSFFERYHARTTTTDNT